MIAYLASVFYMVTSLALIVGFLLWKKAAGRLSLAAWIPVSLAAFFGYQTLVAGLVGLLPVKLGLWTMGLFHLPAVCAIFYRIRKTGEHQTYEFRLWDAAVWLLLLAAVINVAATRFGWELAPVYNSVDPSVHFAMARDFVRIGHVGGMYFAALHNGLWLSVLSPFFGTAVLYKVYVLGDLLWLFFAGAMFWGVVGRQLKGPLRLTLGVLATYMYTFGYPLNSMLFGFSYLGMSITMIAGLVIVAEAYLSGEVDQKIAILLLALACYAVFQCYVLFMPVCFLALLIVMLLKQKEEGALFSKETVHTGLLVFLPATVLGLWYTYRGIFGGGGGDGGTTVSSAISQEGGTYLDLYSNFVFLLPVALYGLVKTLKDRKKRFLPVLFLTELAFMAGLFVLALSGKVSAYYFSKTYHLLWLLVWLLFLCGFQETEGEMRLIPVCCLALLVLFCWMGRYDMEDRIEKRNPRLVTQKNEENFANIYKFNYVFVFLTPPFSGDTLDLFRYVNERQLAAEDSYVPVAGSVEEYYWMQAITDQSDGAFQYWNYGEEQFFEALDREDVHYLIVLYDNDFYRENKGRLDEMERLYENEGGYISIVK